MKQLKPAPPMRRKRLRDGTIEMRWYALCPEGQDFLDAHYINALNQSAESFRIHSDGTLMLKETSTEKQ